MLFANLIHIATGPLQPIRHRPQQFIRLLADLSVRIITFLRKVIDFLEYSPQRINVFLGSQIFKIYVFCILQNFIIQDQTRT